MKKPLEFLYSPWKHWKTWKLLPSTNDHRLCAGLRRSM